MGRFKIGGITGGTRLQINVNTIASSNNGYDPLMRTYTYRAVGMKERTYSAVGVSPRDFRATGMKTWTQKVNG